MIARDVRERLERLILDLPDWEAEEARKPLLGFLRDHPVWDSLYLKGGAAIAAGALIDTCEKQDPESLILLLEGLRSWHKTSPRLCAEIEFLATHLGNGQARRRAQWKDAPYLGLDYFDKEHAPIFFGREAVIRELIQTLNKEQGRRFTIVLGASGSGKSSLVRAGLWARLSAGEIAEMPGSDRWLINDMTPTDLGNDPAAALRVSVLKAVQKHHSLRSQCDWRKELDRMKDAPISSLAERLLRDAPEDTRWLVILDQMEELFTAEMKQTGAAFLDGLIEATQPPSRLRVVATLRADFFHHCLDHPPLKRLTGRDGGVFPLGLPDRRSLEQMVSGPLTEVDPIPKPRAPWVLDPELPATIAADAGKHPGGLALMAFALRELYDKCEPTHRMDVATYSSEEFGGLGGAIRRKARETLELLGKDGEKALEKVFARLVRVDRPEDAPTRLREPLAAWEGDAAALHGIQKFQEARLLVSDRGVGDVPVIEVAHEALLREWPELADWIEERREALHLRERVRAEAHAWMLGDSKRYRQRPLRADLIDEYRKKLEAAGLLDALLKDPAVARLLTPEVDWIQEELSWDETTNLRRWEIGRRLAELGDPRPGVGVRDGVPDILLRPIPGGRVEIEGHGSFDVRPFQMAAFPVTFAQFRAFLDAKDGYTNERWWKDLEQRDRDPAWDSILVNHPVTDVSWFDATAFCRWLSARLEREVRLPDEQEWQQAAQSGKGYQYPWGPKWLDGRANTSESDISHLTAVGIFPLGDSRQGVSDLAGNVWEWCLNVHKEPTKTEVIDDKESRVLRGGSWLGTQDSARADYRNLHDPVYRVNRISFRVVVCSPIGNAGRGTAGH